MSGELDAGSGGSTDDGTSGGDGGTITDGADAFSAIAPSWLETNSDILRSFLTSPVAFILGAIISTLVGGIETITTAVLDSVSFVFFGADGAPSFGTGNGAIGIVDIPGYFAGLFIETARPLGLAIIDVAALPLEVATDLAQGAGPLAPILVAAAGVLYFLAALWVLRTVVRILIDAIPGGGAFL